MQLRLSVDQDTGVVHVPVAAGNRHIGFTNVVHGGLIATVADEAMVWAATWAIRRFCYCGEMTIRFRRPVAPGTRMNYQATVESARSKIVLASFRCLDDQGVEFSSGSGKYIPLPEELHAKVIRTYVDEPESRLAAEILSR